MNTTSSATTQLQFIVLTPFHAGGITLQPGAPYYSCHVAAQRFLPSLRALGTVALMHDPATELNTLVTTAKKHGQQALLLCFMPPHLLPANPPCPMLVLFPWAYDTIPTDAWGGDPRNDWRTVLPQCAGVITHSRHALQAIDAAIELTAPVANIPAPVPAAFFDLFDTTDDVVQKTHWRLSLHGVVIDSVALGLNRSHRCNDVACVPATHDVAFNGVVYCLVVDPIDNSKNWLDSLWAFGFAFRDNANVTLVIKLSHHDSQRVVDLLLYEMRKMAPYRCRIVAIAAWLDGEQFAQLRRGVSFIINAARAEAQGHVVLEFMAAGKPAICPRHTALSEYIDDDCAFVINSSREWIHWPHDPRLMLRTHRYRIDWTSYRDALQRSLNTITQQPARYRKMTQRAHAAALRHSSAPQTTVLLHDFINTVLHTRGLPPLQPPAAAALPVIVKGLLKNTLRRLLHRQRQ